ncbi:hypothetical protein [Sulfuracidifex tepidarius]|uniref:hypothetical protein n=1 Tax=Sulfuracidifex tepidarius TaxID=1294262 RepID=UPI0006D0A2A1|nr:hypothetical protein [Sulfuracidifex tepidarius]
MTKLYSQEVSTETSCKTVEKWLMDKTNVVSNLPYLVGLKGDDVTLRFNRMGIFSYKETFSTEIGLIGKDFIEYKLKAKSSLLELMFSLNQTPKECNIKVMLKYVGEKEWIVSKALPTIGNEVAKTVGEQVKEERPMETGLDFGNLDLGKISDVSKILLKSKLEKTENIDAEPNLAVFLENMYSEVSKYPVVYISGLGEGCLLGFL